MNGLNVLWTSSRIGPCRFIEYPAQHLGSFSQHCAVGGSSGCAGRKSDVGLLIDLTVDGQNHYELKLKRAVDYRDIGEYLAKYFDEIIANRDAKQIWWLVFFAERVYLNLN